MSTRRIILGLIVCLSVAVFVGQTLSQTRGRTRTSKTTDRDRWLREQQRMADQRRRLNEERVAKQMMEFKQRVKDMHDGRDERRNQSIKQRLEATEEQWKVIEPKINRIYFFRNQSSISMGFVGIGGVYSGASGSGSVTRGAMGGYGGGSSGSSSGGYTAGGKSGGGSGGYVMGGSSGSGSGGSAQYWAGPPWRLADRPLTEGEKACEELSELLQDKNSDPEKIKQKMVALRQAREKARNQLAKVRQELREILNSRQEAKLVLLEVLD
jgi:hypothetical protein